MFSLDLCIAGIEFHLDLKGFAHQVCAEAESKYAPFVAEVDLPFVIEASTTTQPILPDQPIDVQQDGAGTRVVMRGLEAHIDWRRRRVVAEVSVRTLHPIENLLRVLVLESLLREERGVLLHSVGLLWEKHAYVFAGKSEAGKTTLARKAGLERVLSDELIALTLDDERGVRVHATPFYGDMGQGTLNASAKLVSLCLFDGKDDKACRELSMAEAMQKLLATVLHYGRDDGGGETLATICQRVLERAPVCGVTTTRDEPVAEIIDRVQAVVLKGKGR